jgi:chromosome partitioning protein
MTAKVVTIAQQKGGAGKTTLAAQLAVAWTGRGYSVALLDVDPQGSLSAWFGVRREGGLEEKLTVAEVPGWKLSGEIDHLKTRCDIIVIDTPPHAETDARVAVRVASLVLVPVQPSPMDLWATKPTLALAQREKTPVTLVLNRLPSRGKLADRVRAKIAAEAFPLAETALGNRSAFAASMMDGKGVVETQPKGLAATEIRALADELGRLLGLAG